MCRVFDVVAHETGHAFLDAVKPSLNSQRSEYSAALHEAFGDITAIIACMRVGVINNKFNEVLTALSNGNITSMEGLNNVCIRKAADHFGHTIYECHQMSKPFTKFFFQMLNSSFNLYSPQEKIAKNLVNLMRTYRQALLGSIFDIHAPYDNNVLVKVASGIIEKIKNKDNRLDGASILSFYRDQFYQHIDLPDNAPIAIPVALNSFKSFDSFASADTWD